MYNVWGLGVFFWLAGFSWGRLCHTTPSQISAESISRMAPASSNERGCQAISLMIIWYNKPASNHNLNRQYRKHSSFRFANPSSCATVEKDSLNHSGASQHTSLEKKCDRRHTQAGSTLCRVFTHSANISWVLAVVGTGEIKEGKTQRFPAPV